MDDGAARGLASPYLPSAAARGCPYAFDPESAVLRRALTDPAPQAATPLPAAALHADVIFLRRLLRQQYAGYPDLLQHRQFDVEAFFAGWLARITRAGATIPFRDGLVAPLATLRQAVPDRHLTIWGAEPILAQDARVTIDEYQTVLTGSAVRPERCRLEDVPGALPATLRTAPLLCANGSVVPLLTLSAAGVAPSVHVRIDGATIRLARRPAAPASGEQPPDVPAYEWTTVGDTSLLTLRGFGYHPAIAEQLRRFVADAAQHLRQPRLLVDLRANRGGMLQFVEQWLAQACQGVRLTYPRLEITGALWPCSEWNLLVEAQIRQGRVDTPAAVEERARLRTTWPSLTPPPLSHLDPGLREGGAAQPYQGQVAVLISRQTGSSGELAAYLLRQALGALLIGERSGGGMQYGEARRFVLPRTGLVCQLPTKRFFFAEEVEGVGLPVDCYLERSAQDAASLVPVLEGLQQRLAEMVTNGGGAPIGSASPSPTVTAARRATD